MTDSWQERREQLEQANRRLHDIAAQLKTELFGIDTIIDRVIDSVRAWYLLPELVVRPVIVCLWGLTGTGKTQLVRRLAQLLGFYDRFVEVQMDGFSNGASWRGAQSISGMLVQSGPTWKPAMRPSRRFCRPSTRVPASSSKRVAVHCWRWWMS